MKRIIMWAMVLVMMIASIGGCFIGRGGGGRGDRDGGYDRGGGHERDGGQQRDGGHEEHEDHQERGERR